MTAEVAQEPAAAGPDPVAEPDPAVAAATISIKDLSEQDLRNAGNRLLRISIDDDIVDILAWGVVGTPSGGFVIQVAVPTEHGRQIINQTSMAPGQAVVLCAWLEYNPEWLPRPEPVHTPSPPPEPAARRPTRRVH